MGHHRWYEAAGKYLAKRNTFTDFVDCAEHLLASGVAKPGSLSCEGRSAGGLLVGNVVNMAPEKFCAAIGGVPSFGRVPWMVLRPLRCFAQPAASVSAGGASPTNAIARLSVPWTSAK